VASVDPERKLGDRQLMGGSIDRAGPTMVECAGWPTAGLNMLSGTTSRCQSATAQSHETNPASAFASVTKDDGTMP
jgi:hypothetical protein